MLASDGNEDLEAQNVWFLLSRILEKRHPDGSAQFSNIDGVIYFTPRVLVHDVRTGMPASLWLSGPRKENDPKLVPFLKKLANAWPVYLASISEIPIVRGGTAPTLEGTKFVVASRQFHAWMCPIFRAIH